MAASFRAYQNAVVGLPYINFVDESTEVTVTDRKIYLEIDNGTWLTPNGIETTRTAIDWPLDSPSPFQVNVLDKDYSINISVDFTVTEPVYPYIFDDIFSNVFN